MTLALAYHDDILCVYACIIHKALYTIWETNFSAKKCVLAKSIHEQRTAFYTPFVYSSFVRMKIV